MPRRIRVERQGERECLLATLCALTGASLEWARRKAAELGEPEWRKIVERPSDFWVAAELIFPSRLKMLREVRSWLRIRKRLPSNEITVAGVPILPSRGRGVVVVIFANHVHGHIAPWENGLVYDPADPADGEVKGVTLAEFLERLKCTDLVILSEDGTILWESPRRGG